MASRIVILTEGHSNPHTAKTGCSVMRYRGDEVVAVLDSTQAGKTADEVLGVGGDTPFVSTLSEASEADTLLIGIAPPGGKVPGPWRSIILEALEKKMQVISGLHDFLSEDPEFSAAAESTGASIYDVRKNNDQIISRRLGLDDRCMRILTVGHDCSIGKMVTSIEITDGLKAKGKNAKFVATGQTGIMVSGEGCPIDRVIADFVSGSAEQLVLANQADHDILVFEGQGSLIHPSYSGVTLGLLHGCVPHALILCYEVLRDKITGVEHLAIPPLSKIKELNEMMASVFQPCPVIGISMNSRRVSAEEAEVERDRMRAEFGLPVCDIFRHGPDDLVEAVLEFEASRNA